MQQERETQTGVWAPGPSEHRAKAKPQALIQTFQAKDEQCIHQALLIQTFFLLPSPELCFFFFILFAEWQKENSF